MTALKNWHDVSFPADGGIRTITAIVELTNAKENDLAVHEEPLDPREREEVLHRFTIYDLASARTL